MYAWANDVVGVDVSVTAMLALFFSFLRLLFIRNFAGYGRRPGQRQQHFARNHFRLLLPQ